MSYITYGTWLSSVGVYPNYGTPEITVTASGNSKVGRIILCGDLSSTDINASAVPLNSSGVALNAINDAGFDVSGGYYTLTASSTVVSGQPYVHLAYGQTTAAVRNYNTRAGSLPVGYPTASGLTYTPATKIGPYNYFLIQQQNNWYTNKIIGAPNQVTGVTLSNYTGTQVDVAWTKPTINVDAGLGYVVRAVPIAGGTTVSKTVTSFDTLSTTLTGLSNGVQYAVTVVACSSMGYSIDSAAVAPGAPTLVSATVDNTAPGYVVNSATLTWNPPASFGTATGVTYNATATQVSTGISTTRTNVTSPYVFDSLVSGSQFSFTVVAVGAATGPSSNALTATPTNVIPSGGGGGGAPSGPAQPAPASPTALTIGAVSDGSVGLSWTAPSGTITNYKVHVYTDSSATVEVGTGTATGSGTASYTVTGLTNGTAYYFRVEAYNGSWGSLSATSAAATPMGTLTGVSFVSADHTNGYTLTFALTASSTLPASSSAYEVYDTNSGSPVDVTIPVSPANRITVTGLAAYTEYTFDITVSGYTGTVSTGAPVRTLDDTSPGYPGVTVTPGNGQLTLSWPDLVDGGSPMVTYYIFSTSSETSPAAALYTLTPDSTNTQVISGLDNGTTYTYYVRAKDAAGNLGAPETVSGTPALPSISVGSVSKPDNQTLVLTIAGSTPQTLTATYTADVYGNGSSYTALPDQSYDPVTGTLTIRYLNPGRTYVFTLDGGAGFIPTSYTAFTSGIYIARDYYADSRFESTPELRFTVKTSDVGTALVPDINTPVRYPHTLKDGSGTVLSTYGGSGDKMFLSTNILNHVDPIDPSAVDLSVTYGGEVTRYVAARPAAPVLTSVVALDKTITIQFEQPAGQYGVKYYAVYHNRPFTSDNENLAFSGNVSSITISADNGSSNTIVIVPVDDVYGYPLTVTASPVATIVPSAPTMVYADNGDPVYPPGTNVTRTIRVFWRPAESIANMEAVVSYTLKVYKNGQLAGQKTVAVSELSTGYINGAVYYDLQDDHFGIGTYTVGVIANNAAGSSSESIDMGPWITESVPDAPTLAIVSVTGTGATISWSADSSSLTGREISTDGTTWTTVDPTATSYTLSGLTEGTSYTVRVRASNYLGTSATANITVVPYSASYVSSVIEQVAANTSSVAEFKTLLTTIVQQSGPVAIPIPAANLSSLVANTAAGVDLTTSKPTIVLAGAALSVSASTDLSNNAVYIPTDITLTIDATEFVVAFLPDYKMTVNGTEYAVGALVPLDRTYLYAGGGSGILLPVPDAPQNLLATAGANQVTLSWSASAGAVSYTVDVSGGASVTGITDTSYTVTGLTNGQLYTFSVRAVNENGAGLPATVTATPSGSPPTAPTNVVATAGVQQITLTWSAVAGATSYKVNRTGGSWITGITGTSYTFTDLSSQLYTVQVAAVNAYGESAAVSRTATPTTPGDPVVPCFFGNAPVLTPCGYRRMDSLRAGDRVLTPEGAEATIERVKVTQCAASRATNPFVIPKGRFGAERRVLISPNHRVVTPSGLVEARHLGLEQEERTGTLTYYNLELSGQAHMIVGGVAVESLAPIKRMVLTMDQFKAAIERKYGSFNASVLTNIQRTCRFLADGRIEVPVLHK